MTSLRPDRDNVVITRFEKSNINNAEKLLNILHIKKEKNGNEKEKNCPGKIEINLDKTKTENK